MNDPEWWRGRRPSDTPPAQAPGAMLVQNRTTTIDTDAIQRLEATGLKPIMFFKAAVEHAEVRLDDLAMAVLWSTFEGCSFRQRVRPVLNEHGFAAQGSFGNNPSLFRDCTFERVRFKVLGGFNLGHAWFEDCRFVDCRWDGHFAQSASMVNCTFTGRMNGCAWSGEDLDDPPWRNTFRDNDFSRAVITDNVAWRRNFPIDRQRWPDGYEPLIDG